MTGSGKAGHCVRRCAHSGGAFGSFGNGSTFRPRNESQEGRASQWDGMRHASLRSGGHFLDFGKRALETHASFVVDAAAAAASAASPSAGRAAARASPSSLSLSLARHHASRHHHHSRSRRSEMARTRRTRTACERGTTSSASKDVASDERMNYDHCLSLFSQAATANSPASRPTTRT